MTTSMYHKNGDGGHMNGAEANTEVGASVGTSLKCLEEPSFEFEASNETTTAKHAPVEATSTSGPPPKKPSYRVLEDPFEAVPPPAKKSPNYRVLEDPMTTAMYDPSTSSEAASGATAATLSNRPAASEVLEGARYVFT